MNGFLYEIVWIIWGFLMLVALYETTHLEFDVMTG